MASEMKGGTRAGTTSFSDRPGVRALIKTYRVRVLWRILDYLHQESKRMLGISSITRKGQPLLNERRFSPGSAFGCFDGFIKLIIPCQCFCLLVSLLFIFVRTSSVGTCSRYRKYVQHSINTYST